MAFRVGDRIMCISDQGDTNITIGRVYTVDHVEDSYLGDNMGYFVWYFNDLGERSSCYASRFVDLGERSSCDASRFVLAGDAQFTVGQIVTPIRAHDGFMVGLGYRVAHVYHGNPSQMNVERAPGRPVVAAMSDFRALDDLSRNVPGPFYPRYPFFPEDGPAVQEFLNPAPPATPVVRTGDTVTLHGGYDEWEVTEVDGENIFLRSALNPGIYLDGPIEVEDLSIVPRPEPEPVAETVPRPVQSQQLAVFVGALAYPVTINESTTQISINPTYYISVA